MEKIYICPYCGAKFIITGDGEAIRYCDCDLSDLELN
jgi:hypothetical protein